MSPGGRIETGYTDNPRLQVVEGSASRHAMGELSTTIERRSERSAISLQPRWRSERYENEETLDGDYRYLDATFRLVTERAQWVGSTNLTRDTTLVSELGTTGLVQADRKRQAMSFSAGPTISLGERTSAGAQLYWLDNRYEDAPYSGLVDYRYGSVSLFSSREVSERARLSVTFQGGDLHVPAMPNAAQQDAALRIGWRYEPALLWTMELSAGPSYATSEHGSEDGAVYGFNVQREAERWTFAGLARREIAPTGRGLLTQRDRVAIDVTRQLTEQLTISGSISGIRNEELLPLAGTAEVLEYGRLDVRLQWMPFEHWRLSLAAGAATQSYSQRPGSAESYKISLGIVWIGKAQLL